MRIGFVGVVTNYEGPGHPAGNDSSYAGLEFPDPQQAAARCARELRDKVDVLVLLSHMGDDRDREFLSSNSDYDLLLSGHTHVVVDTLVGGRPAADGQGAAQRRGDGAPPEGASPGGRRDARGAALRLRARARI